MATRFVAWSRAAAAGLLLAGAALSAGCGGTGTVSGQVTYNGKPVGGGTVTFTSANGRGSKVARVGADGRYTAEEVPAGEVKVAVETESAKPPGPALPGAPAPGRPKMPKPPDRSSPDYDPKLYEAGQSGAAYVRIPADYADPDKSGLSLTVKKGANDYDIPLR